MENAQVAAELEALTAFPEELRRRVQELAEEAVRYRPAPDAWSVAEVVGHIVEVELLWMGRIRQMLAADNPAFPPYNPDEAVHQRDYQSKQPAAMLTSFAEHRREHLEFLHSLRPTQLARTGMHATRGRISIADSIRILAEHDRLHTDQILANLESYRKQTTGA